MNKSTEIKSNIKFSLDTAYIMLENNPYINNFCDYRQYYIFSYKYQQKWECLNSYSIEGENNVFNKSVVSLTEILARLLR